MVVTCKGLKKVGKRLSLRRVQKVTFMPGPGSLSTTDFKNLTLSPERAESAFLLKECAMTLTDLRVAKKKLIIPH